MAKEAAIRITANASGFTKALRAAEQIAKSSGKRMGESLSKGLSSAVKNVGPALRSALGTIKSTVLSSTGLHGGLELASLVRGAMEAEAGFRKLAFSIRAGTGQDAAGGFRALQKEVHQVALQTGQSTEELTEALGSVYQETGDEQFARRALGMIATAATGAHQPVRVLASIAGTLNEKFGVAEDALGETLAAAVSLGNKGGVSVEELAERLGVIGAYARGAGLEGAEGFRQMVGMLNVADNSGKNLRKNIVLVGTLTEQMANAGLKVDMARKLGLDPKQLKGSAAQVLGAIMQKTGGKREELAKAFQGDQLEFLVELGSKYAEKFAEAQGSVKEKGAAALAAFHDTLEEAGKSALSWADLQKEAAAEMQTAERQFENAMTKVKEVFAREEITEAVTKLISKLPALAEIVAKVADFASESPVTAGAIGVGALVGKGMLESAIMAAFSRGGASAAGAISGAFASGGGTAAGALSGAFGPLLKLAGPLAVVAGGVALALEHAEREKQEREAAADRGERYEAGGGGAEGTGAESDSAFWGRDPMTGKVRLMKPEDFGSPQEFDEAKERHWNARDELAREDADAFREDFYGPRWGDKDFIGPPTAAQAEAAAAPEKPISVPKLEAGVERGNSLYQQMLARLGGELKVRITNPDDLRDSGQKTPGTPEPGRTGRK